VVGALTFEEGRGVEEFDVEDSVEDDEDESEDETPRAVPIGSV